MRIAILGISGGVGGALAAQALEAGLDVRGIARRPDAVKLAHPRLDVAPATADDVAALTRALDGCDVAVSAIGTGGLLSARKPTTLYSTAARSLLDAMQANYIDRFVAVTAGGVVPSDGWPWFYKRIIHPLLREMYVDMKRMEALVRESGVRHLFVRPPRLLPGRRTGIYLVERDVVPAGAFLISRADVADYMLRRIIADDYTADAMGIGRAPRFGRAA